ncbi:MAG TPA: Re/Si-specific NAD(P)(+) transhydrogenase subunit alpha [Kofleriaceae bacterium]|nr:Re/Si-specific NAD(P)(+) transhydrogenase subunit alpha [Kofleriaceae bacterium]
MKLGVPKETLPGECRVALVPSALPMLAKAGLEIVIEAGAGDAAGYPDDEYREKGAEIGDRNATLAADAVVFVNAFPANPDAGRPDLERLRSGQLVIGMADPLGATEHVRRLAETGVTAFGMELIPRITRAQSMDVLSSMATVAGYKAVLLGASHLPRMFPMFMTAAGTISPARVLVIGAGVAGLQAIATAKRLGAVVHAYDVRPAVKEQVQSVGAKFVELPLETAAAEDKGGYAKEQGEDFLRRQRELMARVVAESDVVITTAAIPGKKSPVIVTEEMVKGMPKGSVIVDLAAERGGNCELTRANEETIAHGVTILGPTNLPTTVPYHASQMYAKNIQTFLKHIIKSGELALDLEDAIVDGTLMCIGGEVVHPRLRQILGLPEATQSDEPAAAKAGS